MKIFDYLRSLRKKQYSIEHRSAQSRSTEGTLGENLHIHEGTVEKQLSKEQMKNNIKREPVILPRES